MLYPLRLIAETRLAAVPAPGPLTPPARLLRLVRALNLLFDETPAILCPPGGRTVTLFYRGGAYLWRDIAECAGAAAAPQDGPPLRFFGATEKGETAELTFFPAGRDILARRRSASGREFDRLQGLGLQTEWPDADEARQAAVLGAAVPRRACCVAVFGLQTPFLQDCGLLLRTEGSLFAYLAWEPSPARRLLSALSPAHKAALWRAFLSEGLQPAEFDWLWDNYDTDEPPFLLEWDLSLRTVLSELGFRVEREGGFRVSDRAGRERRFDFARGGPAEKVFLKLLFPLGAQ